MGSGVGFGTGSIAFAFVGLNDGLDDGKAEGDAEGKSVGEDDIVGDELGHINGVGRAETVGESVGE